MLRKPLLALAVTLLLFQIFPASAISPNPEVTAENVPTGWWDTWIRDEDHDRIDDLLDREDFPCTVLVDYHRKTTERDVQALESLGLDIVYRCKYINTIIVSNVEKNTLSLLARLPGVAMVEADVEAFAAMNIGVRSAKVRESELYDSAWELGFDGTGINVAVVDSGVDDEHMDFPNKFIAGADFARLVPREDENPDDNFYHGTFVAGILLGTGDALVEDGEKKYMGAAPGAKLVDVKGLTNQGQVVSSRLVQAYEWCIEHRDDYEIRILSASITETEDSDGSGAHCDAVNAVVDSGIVFVTATGNQGLRQTPAPAAADGAITVGALDSQNTMDRSDDTWANYSNYGPRVGGDNITTIEDLKPDVVAVGNLTAPEYNTENGYISNSGTSFSTPIVSGIIALMLEANPFLSVDDIKEILRETAEQRGTPHNVNIDSKYNTTYGCGIVDGHAAVEAALDTPHPDLQFNMIELGDNMASFSWDRYTGTGFDSYDIFVYEGDENEAVTTKTVSNRNTTSATISGLSLGTDYNAMLRLSVWGAESNSTTIPFTTSGTPTYDNIPPVATIESIDPSDIEEGDRVSFSGSGTDEDGNVTGYLWNSDIDGELSTEAEFNTKILSVGNHTVTFKVVDNASEWSPEVTGTVLVRSLDGEEPTDDPPQVFILYPENDASLDPDSTYIMTGTATDDDSVDEVWIKIDDGDWQLANDTGVWSFELDISDLDSGEHTIYVKAVDTADQESAVESIQVTITGGSNIMSMLTEPCNMLMIVAGIAVVAILLAIRSKRKRYKPTPVYPIR